MMVSDNWAEVLRCPVCALTGVAGLSLATNGVVVVMIMPDSFKAESSEYGDTFYRDACDRAASTIY